MLSVSDSINPLKQHSASDTSSLARTRDLIFMCSTVQTRISATIIIRFLVPARNDGMGAIVVTLQKTFVHINKRRRRLLASKMQNIERTNECQARLNWRLKFLSFSFVLMFFCLNHVYTHERKTLCPRHVIPGCDQGPRLPELYNAGETHATITRFLVLARNDGLEANYKILPFCSFQ